MKEKGPQADKLRESVKDLEQALKFAGQAKANRFYQRGIAKSFEICLEYAWKDLKKRVLDEGIEVFSPREVFKQAGRLSLIDDVEKWLGFLQNRNLAVHDYLGISDEDYLKSIQAFLPEVKKLCRTV